MPSNYWMKPFKESPVTMSRLPIFQRKLVKPISDRFLPIFRKTNEQQGYAFRSKAIRSARMTRTLSSGKP